MTIFGLRLALALGALTAFAAPAQAANFVVTNNFDVGAGSLRRAITDANATANSGGPDTISFGDLGAEQQDHARHRAAHDHRGRGDSPVSRLA